MKGGAGLRLAGFASTLLTDSARDETACTAIPASTAVFRS